jgi:hypothetical protein
MELGAGGTGDEAGADEVVGAGAQASQETSIRDVR